MAAPEVEQLLDGIAKGDQNAFAQLVRGMTEPLYYYAGSIVRDSDAAEEVVQKTFIRVFRNRKRLQASGSLRGYCYRIATNLARNHLRDQRLRREREQEAVEMRKPTTDPQVAALACEAWEKAESLPDELRATLHLRFAAGLTLAETAVALDVPEGTVSTRQRSALQRLRDGMALAVPVLPGLEQLGDAMGVKGPPKLAASPGLVTRMEAIVMASAGAKSISNFVILAVVALLLVGGGIIFVAVGLPDRPANVQRVNGVAMTPDDGTPADITDGAPVKPPPAGDSDKPDKTEPGKTDKVDHTPQPKKPQGKPYTSTVRGRVLDSAGKPVAGADVVAGTQTRYESELAEQEKDKRSYPHPRQAVRTDAHGDFELKLAGRLNGDADRGYFTLVATKLGSVGLRSREMWVSPGGQLGGVVLRLYTPGSATGMVVSEHDGKTPVAGVALTISRSMIVGEQQTGILNGHPVCTSDADGKFRFEGLPPGSYTVVPDTNGKSSVITPYTARATFDVAEGAAMTGLRVVFADNRLSFRTDPPLSSLMVEVEIETDLGKMSTRYTILAVIAPDADGVFILRGLYPGIKSVTLKPDGFRKLRREIVVDPGNNLNLGTLKLERGRSLAGLVEDTQGRPVAGAKVSLVDAEDRSAATMTGEDGRFVFGGLPSGQCRVGARAKGYAAKTQSISVPGAAVTIVMRPSGSLRGVVTIAGRAPTLLELGATGLEPINVSAYPADGSEGPSGAWANAGPGGRFAIEDLPAGRYVIRTGYRDLSAESGLIEVKEGEAAEVGIDIPGGAVISGAVTGRDGHPAAGIKVVLTTDAYDAYWKYRQGVKTDTDGNYRFDFVRPGAYYVRLDSDPELMGSEQLSTRAVEVADGETGRLDIDLSTAGGTLIRGNVTVDGKALFKEVVLVEPNKPMGLHSGSIDEQGNYEVSGMKPGKYYLWFADSKWEPTLFVRRSVDVGKDQVIDFSHDYAGCTLSGRVRVAGAPDGFDYTKVSVQFKSDASDELGLDPVKMLAGFKAACDARGNYSHSPLVAGRYRVVASAPGSPAVERSIDLSSDAVLDLFVGGRAGTLKLSIAAVKGADTAGELPTSSPLERMVTLRLLNSDGDEIALETNQRLFALEEGEGATIGSLAPGAYRVRLSGAHVEPVEYSVEVKQDETTTIKPTLQRAAEVHVRVLNDELTAAQVLGARVEVYDAQGKRLQLADLTKLIGPGSEATARKLIIVGPLVAGAYKLVIKLDGYEDFKLDVQVERSHIVEKQVTLVR